MLVLDVTLQVADLRWKRPVQCDIVSRCQFDECPLDTECTPQEHLLAEEERTEVTRQLLLQADDEEPPDRTDNWHRRHGRKDADDVGVQVVPRSDVRPGHRPVDVDDDADNEARQHRENRRERRASELPSADRFSLVVVRLHEEDHGAQNGCRFLTTVACCVTDAVPELAGQTTVTEAAVPGIAHMGVPLRDEEVGGGGNHVKRVAERTSPRQAQDEVAGRAQPLILLQEEKSQKIKFLEAVYLCRSVLVTHVQKSLHRSEKKR